MIVLMKKIPSSRNLRQIKMVISYLKLEKQEKWNTAHYSTQEYTDIES